jgi:aspartate/methionine/tyrosine aminotransferase
VTPEPIREAAIESLRRGETFYASNLGLPALREAIARYVGSLHRPCDAARIAVTSSGVSGLMIAMQALAGAGDEVVAVVPVWPNLTAQPAILEARVKRIPLVVRAGAWTLDLDALLASISTTTRVLVVNAPNNPTGWTLTRDEQHAILAHCRRTGTWILADEVYERLYFDPAPAAPSFLDIAEPADRLVVINSFSKSFLMTGWRLGWMVLPEALTPTIGHLIEFNTSCAPVFVQRGGIAALAHADELVRDLRAHLEVCRDTLVPQLMKMPGVQLSTPRGGMYAFFRISGHADSVALAHHLLARGIGLAPGVAFGDEAEGWLRWCFASRDPARLSRGIERLAASLGR